MIQQRTNKKFLSVLASVLGLVVSGCVLSGPVQRNSRFKVDITSMEKATFYRDTWIYRHPTKRVVDYGQFYVPSAVVYKKPVKKIKHRSPYKAFARTVTERTRKKIGTNYPLVGKPAKGVLRIQISIVDIKPVVEKKGGVTNTYVLDSTSTGSKLEMDCTDAKTGEQIFAISTLYYGDEYAAYQDAALIPKIESAYEEWMTFLMERFDEAMLKRLPR